MVCSQHSYINPKKICIIIFQKKKTKKNSSSRFAKVFSSELKYIFEIFVIKLGVHGRNLCIHLKGDEENDGKNHVSIYLEVADTTDLPDGWEINATFNFFIYDVLSFKKERKPRYFSNECK